MLVFDEKCISLPYCEGHDYRLGKPKTIFGEYYIILGWNVKRFFDTSEKEKQRTLITAGGGFDDLIRDMKTLKLFSCNLDDCEELYN